MKNNFIYNEKRYFFAGIFILLLIILALSTITSVTYYVAREILQENLAKSQLSTCKEIAHDLEIKMQRIMTAAETLAKNPIIINFMQHIESKKSDDNYLAELKNILKLITSQINGSSNITFINLKGDIVYDIFALKGNVSYSQYYTLAMEGKSSMGSTISLYNNFLIPYVAAPIYLHNKIIGMLAIPINFTELNLIWDNVYKENQSSRLTVFDVDNKLLFTSFNEIPTNSQDIIAAKLKILSSPEKELIPIVTDNLRLGTYIKIPTLNWKILVSDSEDVIYTPINNLLNKTIILSSIVSFIFIIIIAFLFYYLVSAINKKEKRLKLTITHRSEVLYKERSLLQAIINSIPNIFYYKNKQGKYQGCNQAFLNLFGFESIDFVINKTDKDLFKHTPNWYEQIKKHDHDALKNNVAISFEETLTCPNGQVLIFESIKSAYKDSAGNPLGLVGVSHDVSLRKQSELVLKQSQQAANAANEAKSIFLANMSHEIRTPLNGIIGMNYLAMKTNIPDATKEYLKKIELSAKNLLSIINDILDFSKIEAGRVELENLPFNLKETVQAVIDILTPSITKANITFDYTIDKVIPQLLIGDSLRLNQILLNLLSNAVKFSPQGKVSLSVQEKNRNKNELELFITITDTGIGISPEQLTKLFTPFTQADASTTRKFGGTGLGLIIIKSLIEMMKGQINVQSSLGKGSNFSFNIFFGLYKDTDKTEQNSLSDNEKITAPLKKEYASLKGMKILLAEDNEINQEIAVNILEEFGCTVTTANDGLEAIEKSKDNIYDLILLDIQMPNLDGIETAKKLRQDHKFNNTPIIAMTANALSSDRESSLAAGMQDHITKPIDPDKLIHTLHTWVTKK